MTPKHLKAALLGNRAAITKIFQGMPTPLRRSATLQLCRAYLLWTKRTKIIPDAAGVHPDDDTLLSHQTGTCPGALSATLP